MVLASRSKGDRLLISNLMNQSYQKRNIMSRISVIFLGIEIYGVDWKLTRRAIVLWNFKHNHIAIHFLYSKDFLILIQKLHVMEFKVFSNNLRKSLSFFQIILYKANILYPTFQSNSKYKVKYFKNKFFSISPQNNPEPIRLFPENYHLNGWIVLICVCWSVCLCLLKQSWSCVFVFSHRNTPNIIGRKSEIPQHLCRKSAKNNIR